MSVLRSDMAKRHHMLFFVGLDSTQAKETNTDTRCWNDSDDYP